MQRVSEMSHVLAILCADIHLSLTAPAARSAEPDWLEAQARPLRQVAELAKEHDCPVVYAGDVFDRWNPPVELVNWAIANLPPGYAIPGQHDLPMHNYGDLKRSAYWTLKEAGILVDLGKAEDWTLHRDGRLLLVSFPWGSDVRPVDPGLTIKGLVKVAVIHSYVWKTGRGYDGSPDESRSDRWRDRLSGYDLAVFGDNHQGFEVTGIYSCGCLIRRKSDERGLRPAVGLLMDDGTVWRHFLDVSEDRWVDVDPTVEGPPASDPAMDELIEELGGLQSDSLDFREAVERYCRDNRVRDGVRRELLDGMG